MCSTVPPKGFPYQTPIGQVSSPENALFSTTQNQFDAGDPTNFAQGTSLPNTQNPTTVPKSPIRRRPGGGYGPPGGGLPRVLSF